MNKKFGIVLILITGVIVILAIVYLVFILTSQEPEQAPFLNQANNQDQTEENNEDRPEVIDISKEPTTVVKPGSYGKNNASATESDVSRIARSFAERFGSFSNQSNFANVKDLKMFMSDKMKNWADSYIVRHQKTNVAEETYYGMTTKAMSSRITSFDDSDGNASVMVQTRRRESIGTSNNSSEIFNQDILITFVKERGAWKVDSAYWQE